MKEKIDNTVSRREFLGITMTSAVLAGASVLGAEEKKEEEKKPVEYSRKIKLGIIGGGHRGNFVGGFIKKHGGYDIHAVADYFPEVANKLGDVFGVDKARCFSGLSGLF